MLFEGAVLQGSHPAGLRPAYRRRSKAGFATRVLRSLALRHDQNPGPSSRLPGSGRAAAALRALSPRGNPVDTEISSMNSSINTRRSTSVAAFHVSSTSSVRALRATASKCCAASSERAASTRARWAAGAIVTTGSAPTR